MRRVGVDCHRPRVATSPRQTPARSVRALLQGSGWLGSVFALLVGVAGFLLVFYVAARLLRISEVEDLAGGILRKLHLKR